jgi:hypothetical protein
VTIRGETVDDDGVGDGRFDVRLGYGDGSVAGVDLVLECSRLPAELRYRADGEQNDSEKRKERVAAHAEKLA